MKHLSIKRHECLKQNPFEPHKPFLNLCFIKTNNYSTLSVQFIAQQGNCHYLVKNERPN